MLDGAVPPTGGGLLAVSAHAADFVWRCGGALALAAAQSGGAHVICLSFGERGESARLWQQGLDLAEVKRIRREEAEKAAVLLGVTIEFLDGGDYPLRPTEAMMDAVLQAMRLRQPATILCHSTADPYNVDHPRAAEVTIEARILAQAHGV